MSVSVKRFAFPTVCVFSVPANTRSRSRSVRTRETVALYPARSVFLFMVGNYTYYSGESQGGNDGKGEKYFRGGRHRAARPSPEAARRRLPPPTNQGFGISDPKGAFTLSIHIISQKSSVWSILADYDANYGENVAITSQNIAYD